MLFPAYASFPPTNILPSRTNSDRIDLMHVLELKQQLDGKTVCVCLSAVTPAGAASAKAALPVLSLLTFDVFDSSVPKVFEADPFCRFFSFDGCYFFLPFEAPQETFMCICFNM